ncbi:MAG: hypothetical protein WD231_02250 [Candidatus Woykebacteria bacterium]
MPKIQLFKDTHPLVNGINPQSTIEETIQAVFLDSSEENKVQRARGMLGDIATTLSDDQIGTIIAQFEFLVGCWLDCYERKLFEGKTLKEVLKSNLP